MIESEEKKKRLFELVKRWTKNTKVDQHLRDGDVPALVHVILGEFYHIHLSCGHLVDRLDEGVDLEIEEDCGIRCGCYCDDCAKVML